MAGPRPEPRQQFQELDGMKRKSTTTNIDREGIEAYFEKVMNSMSDPGFLPALTSMLTSTACCGVVEPVTAPAA
eukprot:7137794-Lingulodinium_polyedra.AAC.1